MLIQWRIIVLVILGVHLFLAGSSASEPVQFVVLGDIPYGKHQLERLKAIGETIRKNRLSAILI